LKAIKTRKISLFLAVAFAFALFGSTYTSFADTASALKGNLALIEDTIATGDSVHPDNGTPKGTLYANKAIDNDFAADSRWESGTNVKDGNGVKGGADDAWFSLQWANPQTFRTIVIYWQTSRPTIDGYCIETSNDGTNWTEVAIANSRQKDVKISDEDNWVDTISLTKSETAKYVRVVVYKMENKNGPSIREFQVYADASNSSPRVVENAEQTSKVYIFRVSKADLDGKGIVATYTVTRMFGEEKRQLTGTLNILNAYTSITCGDVETKLSDFVGSVENDSYLIGVRIDGLQAGDELTVAIEAAKVV